MEVWYFLVNTSKLALEVSGPVVCMLSGSCVHAFWSVIKTGKKCRSVAAFPTNFINSHQSYQPHQAGAGGGLPRSVHALEML